MANKCSSCGKLCGLETEDPEVEMEIDGTTLKATARLVRNSECCGDEVKTADLEAEVELPAAALADHVLDPNVKAALLIEKETLKARIDAIDETLDEHELDVDFEAEGTERCEGKGRGMRTFYGFTAEYTVTCSCEEQRIDLCKGTLSSEVQASAMEDSN
jgi:hypothetical protein